MTLAKFFDDNGDCHCDTCCGDTDCTFCNGPIEVLCSQCRIGPAEFGTLCDYCWELRERNKELAERTGIEPDYGPEPDDDRYNEEPPTQGYPILWR